MSYSPRFRDSVCTICGIPEASCKHAVNKHAFNNAEKLSIKYNDTVNELSADSPGTN